MCQFSTMRMNSVTFGFEGIMIYQVLFTLRLISRQTKESLRHQYFAFEQAILLEHCNPLYIR